MSALIPLLDAHGLVPAFCDQESETVARELATLTGLTVYAKSLAAKDGRVFALARSQGKKVVCIVAKEDPSEFAGDLQPCEPGFIKYCPTTHENAAALRKALPYTASQFAADRPTVGTGDRLGLATPGHIRAVRGTGWMPMLAQQSIREMTRTLRSPDQVMDDATWGVFEEGFRDGFGSDADHLKSIEDIDRTLAAGFTMFTIDPGEYVDNDAETDEAATLRAKLDDLPWDALETNADECRKMFADKRFDVGLHLRLEFPEEAALRAVVKYGRTIAHTVKLYRHLLEVSAGQPFALEMSVDETDSPTTIEEHLYVAHELRRLGVAVASLAPRFIGDFEKGIDYKGDLGAFEEAFAKHVEIAKHFGPYKISIHSGSDKFSIYPIIAKHAGRLAHVKTAGTSYLEALRTVGVVDAALFREILAYAFERYDEDKASYHVSARPETLPRPDALKDSELSRILDINDGRQLLHVTYGSVLTQKDDQGAYTFRERLLQALRENEDTHYDIVACHMRKHVEPFIET